MLSLAIIAFLFETVGSVLKQLALIMQKFAHRKIESGLSRDLVDIEVEGEDYNDDIKKLLVNKQESSVKVEVDKGKTLTTYLSWRWLVGILFYAIAFVIHLFCLPQLNLSLLGCQGAIGLIAAIILSVCLLKEKFLYKYDLPALLLITTGCTLIVFCADKEQKKYSETEVRELLKSTRMIIFTCIQIGSLVLVNIYLCSFLRKLRIFESDVELYEE